MKNLPKARTENLVEQNLGTETLIYDLLIHKAFNLNETSTIVYKACDGTTTLEELKRNHKFSDDFIFLALDELKRNNLLAAESYVSPFAGMNRREVIRKIGLASLLVLPMISALVAPTAASAASGVNGGGSVPPGFSSVGGVCGSQGPNNPPIYCGDGSHCTSTVYGYGTCCFADGGTDKTLIPPHTNYYVPDEGIVYFLPASASSAPTEQSCSERYACCDGSFVYGTITNTPFDVEYNPGYENMFHAVTSSIDCSCS